MNFHVLREVFDKTCRPKARPMAIDLLTAFGLANLELTTREKVNEKKSVTHVYYIIIIYYSIL